MKRSEFPVSSSVWRIRKAKKMLEKMSGSEKIDVMVKAGAMTSEQAAKAKQRLAEIEAEEAQPTDAPAR